MPRGFGLFASASRDAGLQARIDGLPQLAAQPLRCLLLGPPRSGKTSIALHYAFQLAAAGQHVLVLCRRPKLEARPFLLPEGIPSNHLAYQNIHIKYIQGVQDIYAYAACMHLVQVKPAAIIIDDVSDIMQPSRGQDRRQRDAALLRALTCMADGLDHWREHTNHECDVLVTDTCTAHGPAALQFILTRLCSLVLRVTGSPPEALSLQVDPASAALVPPGAAAVTLHMSLTHSHLRLEGVTG